jgi:hypothetical protein
VASTDPDIEGLIRSPKPAFVAEGVVRGDGEDVRFELIFDGHETWLIRKAARTELKTGSGTMLVEAAGAEMFDRAVPVNNDVKVHVGLSGFAYDGSLQETGETVVAGRPCRQVRAFGLKRDDPTPFDLAIDIETGIILRTSRGGEVGFEVRRFRVAGGGDPTQYVGRGTVYMAWDHDHYEGYWELQPSGPGRNLEQMPAIRSTAEALAWARARTNRIVIRPRSDPGRSYWAGGADHPSEGTMPRFEGDDPPPA